MRGSRNSSWASASARPGSPGSRTRGASGAVGCRWIAAGASVRLAIIAVCQPLTMAGSVLEAVRSGGVVSPSERFVVLVSGGRDSVCLLDVLASICGAERLTALHLNYVLRSEESEGNERHVRALCATFGVRCTVHAPPPPPS